MAQVARMRKDLELGRRERDASAVLRRARFRMMRLSGLASQLLRRVVFDPECIELAYFRAILADPEAKQSRKDWAATFIFQAQERCTLEIMNRGGMPPMQRIAATVESTSQTDHLTPDQLAGVARDVILEIREHPENFQVRSVDADYEVMLAEQDREKEAKRLNP